MNCALGGQTWRMGLYYPKSKYPACGRACPPDGNGSRMGNFDRGAVDQRPAAGARPERCRLDLGLRCFFFIGGLLYKGNKKMKKMLKIMFGEYNIS